MRPGAAKVVYKFWARPVGELPARLWWIASRMQAVWNQLADLHRPYRARSAGLKLAEEWARYYGGDGAWARGEYQATWASWRDASRLIAETAGLTQERDRGILERFEQSCTRARRDPTAGYPRARPTIDHMMIDHRFGGGGIDVATLTSRRARRISLRLPAADAYEPVATSDGIVNNPRAKRRARLSPAHRDDAHDADDWNSFGLDDGSVIRFRAHISRSLPVDESWERAGVKRVAWIGRKLREQPLPADETRRRWLERRGWIHREGVMQLWRWALTILTEEVRATPPMRPGRVALSLGYQHVEGRFENVIRIAAVAHEGPTEVKVEDLTVPITFARHQRLRAQKFARLAGKAPESRPASLHELIAHQAMTDKALEVTKATLAPMLTAPDFATARARLARMRRGGLLRLLDRARALSSTTLVEVLQPWAETSHRAVAIQAAARERYLGSRRWYYEQEAVRLCAAYGTIVLLEVNLRRLAQAHKPKGKKGKRQGANVVPEIPPSPAEERALKLAQKYRQWAALGEFRAILKRRAARVGTQIIEIAYPDPLPCLTCARPTVVLAGKRDVLCDGGHRHDLKATQAVTLLRKSTGA